MNNGNIRTGDKASREKILLALLPFWTSLIPPLGISCLKSYLSPLGYDVKIVDANTDVELRAAYDNYFSVLRRYVPEKKRGNFYNLGHDVLQNQMMAYLNYVDEEEYFELVRQLIYSIFYCEIPDSMVSQLDGVVKEFYTAFREYFLLLLDEEKPTVLGLSVFRGNVPASLFACRLAKEKNPQIMTVMGGGAFGDQLAVDSPDLQFFLEKAPYIDRIIIGEGEVLFHKLLQSGLPGSKRVYTLQDLDGDMLDLSSVDIPDYSDLNLQHYPLLAAYASRSCPYQCTFCSETVSWGKFKRKKGEEVVNEMIKLYRKHGSQVFLMSDSLLNPVINDLARCIVKSGVSMYWDGYLRIDQQGCDLEKALLWRRGGFYRARLGVESGSQRILDLMNKKITLEQIKSAVYTLASVGTKTTTMWIVGYPGETEEDFIQTLDLIEELKDDIYEAEANVFWYYLNGQIKSKEWSKKSYMLFPGKAKDMLIIPPRDLDYEPAREEKYQRMCRFVEHCNKLDIPNPYSLNDIYNADKRWQMLHENAVPSLIEFKRSEVYIDENKQAKKLSLLKSAPQLSGDFNF